MMMRRGGGEVVSLVSLFRFKRLQGVFTGKIPLGLPPLPSTYFASYHPSSSSLPTKLLPFTTPPPRPPITLSLITPPFSTSSFLPFFCAYFAGNLLLLE